MITVKQDLLCSDLICSDQPTHLPTLPSCTCRSGCCCCCAESWRFPGLPAAGSTAGSCPQCLWRERQRKRQRKRGRQTGRQREGESIRRKHMNLSTAVPSMYVCTHPPIPTPISIHTLIPIPIPMNMSMVCIVGVYCIYMVFIPGSFSPRDRPGATAAR